MDLVVEHWNAILKQRLAALGGRYTEESIERIGASLNLASLLESKLFPTYTDRWNISFYLFTNWIQTQWRDYGKTASLGIFRGRFLGPGG